MRALVYRNNTLTLEKRYQEPSLEPGEALIRVLQAGICNTDKKEQVITYRAINTQDIKHGENTFAQLIPYPVFGTAALIACHLKPKQAARVT